MQLHCQTFGQGDPLVVLHGLFGSSDNWAIMARTLGDFFHVFALDQRNHGRSPHCEIMDYDCMAGDVGEFLDGHDLERAHILGHSMGGKTAMRFALNYPDRINRLVVVDIAPRRYAPRYANIFEALLQVHPALCSTRSQVEKALAAFIPDRPVRQFVLKNVVRDESGGLRWQLGIREIYANRERLEAEVRAPNPSPTPALFLRGKKSDFVNDSDLIEIRTLLPNAELRTIEGAGHLVHVENPTQFLHETVAFLSQHKPNHPIRHPGSH